MREQITIERQEGYAVLTMNKPQRRNALGTQSMRELDEVLQALAGDKECRAIVLAGAPPAFCAGSDLKELGGLSIPDMCTHEAYTAKVARSMAYLPVPVIAAVEGYALGGGFILATSCDVVVSGASTKWAMPEVKNGWIPPWGLQTLIARCGPVKARLITWGSEEIDGAEALRLGVADKLAGDGNALDEACAMAERLAGLPADAVRSTKRFFGAVITGASEQMDVEASRLFASDCEGEAAKQVLAKFTETS
ncbi:MAG: enoyl-CoA hydratase/isomerase family protein [Hyphomicrobiales bacterium]|jgi:enoyl-CoA hydratase/carnithine racemase